MTLASQVPVVYATGNGSATVFPYDFPIPGTISDPQFEVYLIELATGVRIPLVQGSDYSITGLGGDNGGAVTYPLSGTPLPSTRRIVIARKAPYNQATDIYNAGTLYLQSLEEQLDKLAMQTQQLAEVADRSVKVQVGPEKQIELFPEPDAVLVWNSDGTALVNSPAIGQSVADAEAAAAAALAAANSNFTFASTAVAGAATIPDAVTIVMIAGPNGGPFTSISNGSTDTFTSNGGTRTWYRVLDVAEDRLSNVLKSRINGPQQGYYANQDIVQNNRSMPTGIKMVPKPGSVWDKGIFQGLTYVSRVQKWFTAWDTSGTSQLAIMRHGYGGDYELCSADAAGILRHGQTLGHFYDRDGNLKLYTSGLAGGALVIFDAPSVDGAALSGVRIFNLVGPNWVVGYPGPSADGQHVVYSAWNNDEPDDPYHALIFNLQALLDGPDGDRMGEHLVDVRITPRNDYYSSFAPTMQAIACDEYNIYVGQSTDTTSDTAYFSCFSIATKKRMFRVPFVVGKAFAATKGAGIRHELEGFAWIKSPSGDPKLWCGIRTRNNDNSGSDCYAMPFEEKDIAANGSPNYPGQYAFWYGGASYDGLIPTDQAYSIWTYGGPDAATAFEAFRISGSQGRAYAFENFYVGTSSTLFPTSAVGPTGINIFGALGRIAASADGLMGSWQRQTTTGSVHEFRYGTTLVGSISITASATAFNISSDETFKRFIGAYDPDKAIEIIKADPVRDFHWNEEYGGGYAVGWGAQTSHAVSPDLATPGGWFFPDGSPANKGDFDAEYRPWGIDQSKRTPYLWAAVSRLIERVEELERKLADKDDKGDEIA